MRRSPAARPAFGLWSYDVANVHFAAPFAAPEAECRPGEHIGLVLEVPVFGGGKAPSLTRAVPARVIPL